MIARDVVLAYPNFSEVFEIYADSSSRQLGTVITQKGRPIAFFSQKLSPAQQKYSVIELELLFVVERLKEFSGMFWGQQIKVYTDHQNLERNDLGLTSNKSSSVADFSGSDGDLLFQKKGARLLNNSIPYVIRTIPQSWHTSSGIFHKEKTR